MTFSLDTLRASSSSDRKPGANRFAQELGLTAAAVALLFACMALATYSAQDAAWSTSGTGLAAHNWGGRLGAWLADGAYFLLGYSAWWVVLAGMRWWFRALAQWLRAGHGQSKAETAQPHQRALWVLALLCLLLSSTSLEWSRLYRFEAHLPGYAGGVLGWWIGPLGTRWMGFTGAALVWIAVLVLAMSQVLRFSWSRAAQGIGAWLVALFDSLREKREIAEDKALGLQAAREREEVVHEERVVIEEQHPIPMQIEPVLLDVPKSERVAKERQKPLFMDMPDSKLPQVDLLDAMDGKTRQECVAPETLEMTSRLIEKKLKDFGVEVRVVAAAPGPVITRYEIEPATGVKGSQIVGLAKDLARSLSLVSIRVVETIPGKNFMALELPNARRQSIKLSEILGSQTYNEAKSMLTMGLGKDIAGQAIVADLAKMPHCLVAGTTGSGKSVGINAMILSLLYKAEARDVRLLLIDPKMLEMSVYEGIPHLLAPVVTDMKQAAHGLNWCVAEMERR